MAEREQYENPYESRCSIVFAMELIGSKWKIPVLWHLSHYETMRYNELKRHLKGISNTALTRSLRELESDGLVIRESAGTVPPMVSYRLSEAGQELSVPLQGLYDWGDKYKRIGSMNGAAKCQP